MDSQLNGNIHHFSSKKISLEKIKPIIYRANCEVSFEDSKGADSVLATLKEVKPVVTINSDFSSLYHVLQVDA